VKYLCKLCPQSAICAITDRGNRTGGIWDTCFYPRRIETWNKTHTVFECYSPVPTGEKRPSNGGGPTDVFRISKAKKSGLRPWR